MSKRILPIFFLCLIPLSALALALYCLETYDQVVHNDSGFFVCGYCILAFLISFPSWLLAKKSIRCATAIWIVSTVILAFVFYVGMKIPFCVECDRVTAEDLGFLTYWITPMMPPQ